MKRWLIAVVMVAATMAWAGEPSTKPNTVDADAYRAAMERLRAKSATTEESRTDRLERENRELKETIAALRAEVAALTAKMEKATPPEKVAKGKPDPRDAKRIAGAMAMHLPVWGMSIDQLKQIGSLDERAERFGPGIYDFDSLQNGVTEFYRVAIDRNGLVTDVVPLGHGTGVTWRP